MWSSATAAPTACTCSVSMRAGSGSKSDTSWCGGVLRDGGLWWDAVKLQCGVGVM